MLKKKETHFSLLPLSALFPLAGVARLVTLRGREVNKIKKNMNSDDEDMCEMTWMLEKRYSKLFGLKIGFFFFLPNRERILRRERSRNERFYTEWL